MNRLLKKNLKSLTCASALILTLAACGGGNTNDARDTQSPQDGEQTVEAVEAEVGPRGTLRVGLGSLVSALDPNATTTGPPATIVFYPVFDALTFIAEDGSVLPGLATTWEATGDKTWVLTLRQGVVFSNGDSFDARDVKFTFDRVLDPENKQVVRSRVATINSVVVLDDHTVQIETIDPDPILLKRLASVFILPSVYFQEIGADRFAMEPVGTGPFSFGEFQPSSTLRLDAVETSWRGLPKVTSVEITAMPVASTRVSALQAGAIDMAEGIPPDQAARLSDRSDITIASVTLGQANVIILDTVENEALGDVRVRQALNYAVDKAAIVDNLMRGYAQPTGQLVANNGVGHDSRIEPYPYDPSKARELLADAGYADGFEMTLYSTEGLQLNDRQMVEATAGYLRAVGVKAQVSVIETGAFVQGFHGGGMSPAFFIGWWYFPAMDGDFVYVWNQSDTPQSRFHNDDFDLLFKESRRTLDAEARLGMMQEMANFIHDEAPVIFLLHPAEIYALGANVTGFSPRSDRVIWFDEIGVG